MKKSLTIIFLTLISFLLIMLVSCVTGAGEKPAPVPSGEPASRDRDESPYIAPETLAKRLVLYKSALQENELASVTALPDSFSNLEVPELASMLNETWWSIDWEGAHLNPLSPAEITSLEGDVFPLINTGIEDQDEDNGWVLLVLSFDADLLKQVIAQAHDEWMPEQHTVFQGTYSDDCMQVWCIKIQGEWKILAHFDCEPDVEVPDIAQPPADLFSPEEPVEIDTTDTGE